MREEPEAGSDGGSQGGRGGDAEEPGSCLCNGQREQATQTAAEAASGGGGGQREEEGDPALPKLEHVQTVRGGPAKYQ